MAALAYARKATYTRYADDLTFSFLAADHGAVADVLAATKKIVGQEGTGSTSIGSSKSDADITASW